MESIPITVRNTGTKPEAAAEAPKPKKRRLKKLIVLLVVILVIAAGVIAAAKAFGLMGSGSLIEGGKYQALFLTNGQVYFGKLAQRDDDTYVLTDIFYLQTDAATDSQNPQATADKSADTSDNVKLIKLGSEVHGPEDKMVVNRDQVLFFENLKGDGKVSQSIEQYSNKQ